MRSRIEKMVSSLSLRQAAFLAGFVLVASSVVSAYTPQRMRTVVNLNRTSRLRRLPPPQTRAAGRTSTCRIRSTSRTGASAMRHRPRSAGIASTLLSSNR
jgi:hypothetical protein